MTNSRPKVFGFLAACATVCAVMLAVSVLTAPPAAGWHNWDDTEPYNRRSDADKLPEKLRDHVSGLCAFSTGEVDTETGWPRYYTGFGDGCEAEDLNAVLEMTELLMPYNRWAKRTAHAHEAEFSSYWWMRWMYHITQEDLAEYMQYAKDTGRYGAAISRVIRNANLLNCREVQIIAKTSFDVSEENVRQTMEGNGRLPGGDTLDSPGYTWAEVQYQQRMLQPVADWMCAVYRWYEKHYHITDDGRAVAEFSSPHEKPCYRVVKMSDSSEPKISWQRECRYWPPLTVNGFFRNFCWDCAYHTEGRGWML